MVFIDNVYADEVLDSRGNPTVRATVVLSDGTKESAIVQVVQAQEKEKL